MPSQKNKPLHRQALRFFLLALLFFVVLMVPWPGVQRGYAAFFRAGGNFLFSDFGQGGANEFRPLDDSGDGKDTVVRIAKIGGKGMLVKTSSRYNGYLLVALTTALILATPINRSRKLWALGGGLLGVHCFVTMRVALWLVNLDRVNSLSLFTMGKWSTTVCAYANHIFVTIPEAKFVVPVAIWVLVSFRREDVAGFTPRIKFEKRKADR